MPEVTNTVTFKYTKEDIANLVKADVAKRLTAKQLGECHVYFAIDAEEDPTDWRAEYPLSHVLGGATASVMVTG
jgi:hypothetical protein